MSDKKLSVWLCPRCGMNMSASWGVEEECYGRDHGHYHSDEPHRADSAYFVRAEEVEVVAVSAPNVLSVDEARLMTTHSSELDAWENEEQANIEMRLADWAAEERG